MKYMFMTNLEMADFCQKNYNFMKNFEREFSLSFPELVSYARVNNELGMLLNSAVNKTTGYINPVVYYRGINKLLPQHSLDALYCLVLFTNDFHFVGSADIGFVKDTVSATITNFFIARQFRKKKYGKFLMRTILRQIKQNTNIKKVMLEVEYNNKPAQILYTKMGFTEIDVYMSEKKRMEMWL
jgi:ribosomal protein S18 acetylase RimI-like enzyme